MIIVRLLAGLLIAVIAACDEASVEALPGEMELTQGWYAPDFSSYDCGSSAIVEPSSADDVSMGAEDKKKDDESFKCDGRTYCAEMTSCAEARYFLKHCAAAKMDGDGDGIPCEEQWCGHGG